MRARAMAWIFRAQCFGVKFTGAFESFQRQTLRRKIPAGTNRERMPQGAFPEPAPGFLVETCRRAKRRFAQLRDSGFEGGLYVGTNGGRFSRGQPTSPTVLHDLGIA